MLGGVARRMARFRLCDPGRAIQGTAIQRMRFRALRFRLVTQDCAPGLAIQACDRGVCSGRFDPVRPVQRVTQAAPV